MTRSAWPNTTSMSCSVNSTAIRSSRARVGGELHQPAARARRHARRRLVHQQQPRSAGERQRELDALRVAVGERRAALVGEAWSCARARAARRRRRAARVGGARADRRDARRAARAARSARSRGRSSTRTSPRPGTCGPRPCCAIARGGSPSMRSSPSDTVPASGASWPLTRLKQVVLPAPFGPISATSSPASTSNETSRTASHAVERLRRARRPRSTGVVMLATVRVTRWTRAADAHRKREHDHEDRGAEHRVPVVGDARERVGEPGERGRADERAGERVEPAEQHHDERVDRARNRQRLRRDAALGERVESAGEPGERAGERERRATAMRRTSMPSASARSGESRPARSA